MYQSFRFNDKKNAFFRKWTFFSFILAVHERTGVCAYMDATLVNSAFIYFLGLD